MHPVISFRIRKNGRVILARWLLSIAQTNTSIMTTADARCADTARGYADKPIYPGALALHSLGAT